VGKTSGKLSPVLGVLVWYRNIFLCTERPEAMEKATDIEETKVRSLTGSTHALRATVASAFGLAPENLAGATRGSRRTAFARQVGMYIAATTLGLNFTEAGALFRRDRTTAAHACRTIEEGREDRRIDSVVDCVERAVEHLVEIHRRAGACDGR
jgi:chromosomal replication initiation ATPase DnaA